ncbi:hypothetical protein C8J56DRAFT_897226 [Mycena floridula]|nr:hypothetical protein C8J56DRAFT_897226 [Mycena floridula]
MAGADGEKDEVGGGVGARPARRRGANIIVTAKEEAMCKELCELDCGSASTMQSGKAAYPELFAKSNAKAIRKEMQCQSKGNVTERAERRSKTSKTTVTVESKETWRHRT